MSPVPARRGTRLIIAGLLLLLVLAPVLALVPVVLDIPGDPADGGLVGRPGETLTLTKGNVYGVERDDHGTEATTCTLTRPGGTTEQVRVAADGSTSFTAGVDGAHTLVCPATADVRVVDNTALGSAAMMQVGSLVIGWGAALAAATVGLVLLVVGVVRRARR